MTDLCYWYRSAFDVGENRHAQLVMDELGIRYKAALAQSFGEQYWFFDCTEIPDPLPSYLTILKISKAERDSWLNPR